MAQAQSLEQPGSEIRRKMLLACCYNIVAFCAFSHALTGEILPRWRCRRGKTGCHDFWQEPRAVIGIATYFSAASPAHIDALVMLGAGYAGLIGYALLLFKLTSIPI
jgi:hypothetical protein